MFDRIVDAHLRRNSPERMNEDATLFQLFVALALFAGLGGGIAVYGPIMLGLTKAPTLEPGRLPTFEQRLEADDGKATRFAWGAAIGFGLCAAAIGHRATAGADEDQGPSR